MASGGSVIGIKYNGGVLVAADTLLSYGSLAKWPNIPRIKIIGAHTAVCATGDYADFQEMTKQLSNRVNHETLYGEGDEMEPSEIFSYLHRYVYHNRCEFKPCMCQFVVLGSSGGVKDSFLGAMDDIGTRWVDECVATGYGEHIALPLLREALEQNPNGLSREQALEALRKCLMVLFYRECRAINKFQIADASNGKVEVCEPFSVDTQWEFEGFRFEKTAIIR